MFVMKRGVGQGFLRRARVPGSLLLGFFRSLP
jgi:hypothetical protein